MNINKTGPTISKTQIKITKTMDKITKTQTKITGKISTAIVQVLDHGQDQQDWDKDHHQHVDHSQNYAWLDLRVRQKRFLLDNEGYVVDHHYAFMHIYKSCTCYPFFSGERPLLKNDLIFWPGGKILDCLFFFIWRYFKMTVFASTWKLYDCKFPRVDHHTI